MSTPHPTRPDVWPLRFISVEAVSGLVLLAAAAIALACANSPLSHAYESLWQQRLSFGVPFLPAYDLRFWVNDGLMTVFFLLVGLEIRPVFEADDFGDNLTPDLRAQQADRRARVAAKT